MLDSAHLGHILMSLQDLLFILYYEKIPDLGYLYLSSTFLMFIFEFKNIIKLRSLKADIKRLNKLVGDKNAKKEKDCT